MGERQTATLATLEETVAAELAYDAGEEAEAYRPPLAQRVRHSLVAVADGVGRSCLAAAAEYPVVVLRAGVYASWVSGMLVAPADSYARWWGLVGDAPAPLLGTESWLVSGFVPFPGSVGRALMRFGGLSVYRGLGAYAGAKVLRSLAAMLPRRLWNTVLPVSPRAGARPRTLWPLPSAALFSG
jgi:hypothetical protein